jgi:hypothetical protein
MMNEDLFLMNDMLKLPEDATLDGTKYEIKQMPKVQKVTY